MGKQYTYRFKTKKEFENEYGEGWRSLVRFRWDINMDYLLGQPLTQDIKDIKFHLKYYGDYKLYVDCWTISFCDHLVLFKKSPDYKPKILVY
jgi:hypothetical protein